ncbi:hypothetical protein K7432_003243 [Basidiobolus ranarum]|uniref:Uncharacterized protein n=1 Tax=Basidiobolus ranarum TaxID=34480 RepID=A0ABR2W6L8_9FUNG
MSNELYKSNSFKGYSLWLSPSPDLPVNGLLQTLITKASESLNSPNFQPHVTLLGAIEATAEEVIKNTQELVTKLQATSIHLEFDQIAVGDAYFQSVLWKVANNENTKVLREVNQLARKFFDKEKEPIFYPHLSLVYGDFTHEQRLAIRDRILLGDFGNLNEQENLDFQVDRILIVDTEGKPHEWKLIAEIMLN